jgi:hypothetical protein
MNNTIFYSWQSDLPNANNRSFIESCLQQAVKQLSDLGQFSVELNVDRDTLNEPDTPSIIESIFTKIDSAKIFVADISIINQGGTGRKTPNPNVLVELGYAAKSIGWEKIICVYNLDYGSIEDLPFDLKQRRLLSYSLKEKTKPEARKSIANALVNTVRALNQTGQLFDTINDFVKVQVDTELLTIIGHLHKIIFGYGQMRSLNSVSELLELTDTQIAERLTQRKLLGFQIFKKFEVNEAKLTEIANRTISSQHHGKAMVAIIIDFIRWVGSFDKFNTLRTSPDLFQPINETPDGIYRAINGKEVNPANSALPSRFMLLKQIDDEHGQVQDFGDFIERKKIEGLLKYYKINPASTPAYVSYVRHFIQLTEKWLDLTDGEFIIENIKMFEIHRPADR